MPSHRIHRLIDRLLLGREYPLVHKIMDRPYKWLGRRHRILLHDLETVMIFSMIKPEYGTVALLHIIADKGWSMWRKRLQRSRSRV